MVNPVEDQRLPKIIRDPVHNLIELPDNEEGKMILDLIDTPEFQRLRRIRQLGLASLTYPGAEHSRWGHSLGVYHVARRMLDTLRNRHGEESQEYEELKKLRLPILAAALLHDVGHGPFSHVFERAMPKVEVKDAGNDYPKNHEGWSLRIIRERVAPVLKEHSVNPEIVAGLIEKKNRKYLLAKDFISSQLDADRMDYLLRDSKATGSRYGEFDLEWILHSLRIGKVQVKGKTDGDWRLCFDSRKSIHVIEEYIQARRFMYVQVYVHKTTRAYEALLTNILGLAAAISSGNVEKVPLPCPVPLTKMLAGQPVETSEYLLLDDHRLWCTLMDWMTHENSQDDRLRRLRRMCRKLVCREQPYKAIELEDRTRQDKALQLVSGLKGNDLEFSCHRDTFSDVAYRNALYRKSKEDEEEEDRVIYVLDRTGLAHPAESESKVIDELSRIETTIFRLYYDEEDQVLVEKLKEDSWI